MQSAAAAAIANLFDFDSVAERTMGGGVAYSRVSIGRLMRGEASDGCVCKG